MIDARRLLADLQGRQKALEQDLRAQLAELPALRQTLEADYRAAREAERTAETFASWCEGQITQAAVAWLLAGVFLRFCIALIESSAWIGLLERPEYKCRWNQPRWAELEQAALKQWLLDRLETPRYWPEPLLRGAAELVADAERDAEFNDAATRKGWPVAQLLPLLAAIAEELPWVLQWHNELNPEYGVRLGDFFREQLSRDLHAQGLTRDDLAN